MTRLGASLACCMLLSMLQFRAAMGRLQLEEDGSGAALEVDVTISAVAATTTVRSAPIQGIASPKCAMCCEPQEKRSASTAL